MNSYINANRMIIHCMFCFSSLQVLLIETVYKDENIYWMEIEWTVKIWWSVADVQLLRRMSQCNVHIFLVPKEWIESLANFLSG